jgi:hypothetical protein
MIHAPIWSGQLYSVAAVAIVLLGGILSLTVVLCEYAQFKNESGDHFFQFVVATLVLAAIFFLINVAISMVISADELASDAVPIAPLAQHLSNGASCVATATYLSAYIVIIALIGQEDHKRWLKMLVAAFIWAILAVGARIYSRHIDGAPPVLAGTFLALSVVGGCCYLGAQKIQRFIE